MSSGMLRKYASCSPGSNNTSYGKVFIRVRQPATKGKASIHEFQSTWEQNVQRACVGRWPQTERSRAAQDLNTRARARDKHTPLDISILICIYT